MRSLNTRLTLSAAVVLAVFIALAALALERAFRESARSARHDRLLAQVYLLMAAAEVDDAGALTFDHPPPEPRLELPGSGLYASVIDGSGNAVWRSRSHLSAHAPPAESLPAGVQQFSEARGDDGHDYLTQSFGVRWTTPGGSFPFTFRVSEDLSAYREQLAAYRRTLWTGLGAMAALLLVAQWLLLRWGLRPLRHVAGELGQLEQGRRERIEGDYPSEIQRLTDNLNAVLAQERTQQKRYRDALADLAHSLKTPLAVMRAAIQESRADPTLARSLDEQVERMDRIVAYQLQRASASGASRLSAAHALRPAIDRLVAALRKVHAGKQVQVDAAIEDGAVFRGNDGDLTELLGNLLDNAFKWARRQVRIEATMRSGALVLRVDDDGPGIPPEAAERIMERGTRADESVPGHGIGLAVVRDILHAYGGHIEIGRSTLGGAAISLDIPGK
jgi:two-component system sensor histidine kinase PhoQ